MCNSIVCAIFNRDYLKILIFELQNLSSSTFFEQSTSYLAVMFLRQFRRDWLSSIFELRLHIQSTDNNVLYNCDRKSEKHTIVSTLNMKA
jgi:hypothetical protein